MPGVRLTPAEILKSLLKFIVVAGGAAAVGVGLGLGFSRLSGSEDGGDSAVPAAPPANLSTPSTGTGPGAEPAKSATTDSLALKNGLSLQVDSASFLPATTPKGRASKQARLTVRATLSNSGTKPATAPLGPVFLREGGVLVRADPGAKSLAAAVLGPVPARGSANVELRFDTTGVLTTTFTSTGQVNLRFGANGVIVKLR